MPKENLLGSPEITTAREGFAGVMQTFDNTRPMVAGMAVGVARAALERTRELLEEAGVTIDYDRPLGDPERGGGRVHPPRGRLGGLAPA